MCYLLLAINQSRRYPFVLAANRDEYYQRDTAQLHYWHDKPDIAGGRDLQQNGTWMAVNLSGKFAAITNFREPKIDNHSHRSRGLLISDYLDSDISDDSFSASLYEQKDQYNGFNLIYGHLPDKLLYYSNRSDRQASPLSDGVYALSNHLLDTAWPKVVHGKQHFEKIISQPGCLAKDALFDLLGNDSKATRAELPETGIGQDFEHLLSSIYIESEHYGTRSSSVLMVNQGNSLDFTELTYRSDSVLKENPVQLSIQLPA